MECHTGNLENDFENGAIVLDYFDKLLVSYEYEHEKSCKECLKERFINTRKDRNIINNKELNTDYKSNDFFSKIIYGILDCLKHDTEILDGYGRRKVCILDKNTRSIEFTYYNAIPDCKVCSTLPDDTEEISKKIGEKLLEEINSLKEIPFRNINNQVFGQRIENISLDKNVGIITTLLDCYEGAFPIAIAILPLENGVDEPGTGRTNNIQDSRSIALLEAMERYAGFRPRGKKTTIYDSYSNLIANNNILDFDKLILNEQSLSNKSKYRNIIFYFHRNQKYHCVYGYNITTKKVILVPETLAYYGLTLKQKSYHKEIFVYEISNGCSTGASLLESSYYGLLEDIERDAFLTAWYTSRGIKKIIFDYQSKIMDDTLRKDLEGFYKYYSDFDIEFYDITSDISVPVVLATVYRKEIEKDKMNFMCAAAADNDIQVAMKRSLHEITSIFFGLQNKFEDEYHNIKIKAEDLSLVKTMEDHSLVYGYYKNLEKIKFRKQVIEYVNISDYKTPKFIGINKCYRMILDELEKLDKQVVIIDQTTEEMRKIGLFCSKTLTVGLLPMTFGANNIRISSARIKDLEKKEGSELKITFYPHPFP